jgi:hypothetical protein
MQLLRSNSWLDEIIIYGEKLSLFEIIVNQNIYSATPGQSS